MKYADRRRSPRTGRIFPGFLWRNAAGVSLWIVFALAAATFYVAMVLVAVML